MTINDAIAFAVLAGLLASEEGGFCVLRWPGRGIAARGDTWEEAFKRLEAADAARLEASANKPEPPPPAEPGCLF